MCYTAGLAFFEASFPYLLACLRSQQQQAGSFPAFQGLEAAQVPSSPTQREVEGLDTSVRLQVGKAQ